MMITAATADPATIQADDELPDERGCAPDAGVKDDASTPPLPCVPAVVATSVPDAAAPW